MIANANMPVRFRPAELQYFNWIYGVSPCFPVKSSKINIINDPRKFYDTLCERFRSAKRRISIASLYIGTGPLEKILLENTKENLMKSTDLRLNILLDYQRGTRGEVNSVTLLKDLLNECSDKCKVNLYQTPRLQGSWSKALPSRYNEIVGLQHMKLYIADDSVLLSGANCSNDYFGQRQDRYIEIHDSDLANFYNDLIGMTAVSLYTFLFSFYFTNLSEYLRLFTLICILLKSQVPLSTSPNTGQEPSKSYFFKNQS